MRLRTFLTSSMGLLTVLVFGLACVRRNVFWLWIAFLCALVSGLFIQLLLQRRETEEEEEEGK
jgi:hypothetical protein